MDISQGSVATCLTIDEIFNCQLTINSLPSLTVKEFGKSINIWQTYEQKYSVSVTSFFGLGV